MTSECKCEKRVNIADDIRRFGELGLLETLLADRSTGTNIIWATSSYESLGDGYGVEDEIVVDLITGEHEGVVQPRAEKACDEQAALTRAHAEVFTPTWVCKKMIDYADEAWWESWNEAHPKAGALTRWHAYVESNRLEITCGEAPYLVNRYDAETGEYIDVSDRTGILSRKLKLVSENTKTKRTWIKWAIKAIQSTYGYEFQGDNLLIARINMLCTVEDYLEYFGYPPLSKDQYHEIAEIISWNLWQMDGLSGLVPYGKEKQTEFALPGIGEEFADVLANRGSAIIYDWKSNKKVEYRSIRAGRG
jgi:type II restriction enzyme